MTESQEASKGEPEHLKVLVVFASPRGTCSLDVASEDRIIRECIQLSEHRDNIDLEILHASTIHDVRRALLRNDYRIIHFSGHGIAGDCGT